jgi:hypothetical protein
MSDRIARRRFTAQRAHAKKRGISFEFTFDEWWNIWQKSGRWAERGCGKGQYVMARFGDIGPYASNNVKIITIEENSREHALTQVHTEESRAKRRALNLGKKMTAEQRSKIRAAALRRRGEKRSEKAKANMSAAQRARSADISASNRRRAEIQRRNKEISK